MSAPAAALGAIACALAGTAGAIAAKARMQRLARSRRREAAYGPSAARRALSGQASQSPAFGLRYAERLTRSLYGGLTSPLSPSVRSGRAASTRAGAWYERHAHLAGCSKEVSVAAFCEARFRLSMAATLAGALIGVLLSSELAVIAGAVGAFVGGTAIKRSVKAACKRRASSAQMYLSEMLEVVALGLRSGLTFDRSFELYGSHFSNEFARSCAKAHRSWSLGLVTREEALRALAGSYDCDQLRRVVDSIVRSLRFGSPLVNLLEEAANQSRASYRSSLEERVAKAPVKMMLPTGTLILPAMLMLVLGPILLELAGGF